MKAEAAGRQVEAAGQDAVADPLTESSILEQMVRTGCYASRSFFIEWEKDEGKWPLLIITKYLFTNGPNLPIK